MTAAALRAWRKERHITQTELAESLQVHSRTIAAWEATRQAIPPYLERALRDIEREMASTPLLR